MSYSTPSSRQFPRASVYSSPATHALWRKYGGRAYGQDPGSDFTSSDVLTVPSLAPPDPMQGGDIAAAAAAAVAAACAQTGGTLDTSGNCIPQAETPTPVTPSHATIPISVLTQPSTPPVAPAKLSLASTLTSGPMPWILGGLVVVGVLAVASKRKSAGASAR